MLNLQYISQLLALSTLLLTLLALLPSASKSKLIVLSSITIRFATSRQNYIFKTAREKGKVVK